MLVKYNHLKIILFGFAVFSITVLMAVLSRVQAAGVSISLTPSAISSATPTNISVHYVSSSAQYQAGNTVDITVPSGVTLANCAAPTTNADTDASSDGTSAVNGQTYTYTFTGATTTATTTGVSFCINVSASTGNYGVTVVDSKTVPANNDYGGALIYAGSANVVTVTAEVQQSLAFVIRDSNDQNNTTACSLGTLTLSTVKLCSYRLKVTTNALSGYTITVDTDGDLRRSGSGNVADNNDIDPIADNSTVQTGVEGYGVAVIGGASTGGIVTVNTSTPGYNFGVDDTPLPMSSPTLLLTSSGSNSPSATDTTHTTLITHRAAMDGDTYTGSYTQHVTYTVSASF